MSEQNKRVSDVEISNLLHRMNLDRPDIAALPSGATISGNITTYRQAADLIKRLAACRHPDLDDPKVVEAVARALESSCLDWGQAVGITRIALSALKKMRAAGANREQ